MKLRRQPASDVAGLVNLTALDQNAGAEGAPDRLGQSLCAIHYEQAAGLGGEAATDEIVRQRLDHRGIFGWILDHPQWVFSAVRLREAAGVIRGYAAIVDPKSVGLRITAFIRITLARHDRDAVTRFEARVREIDEILDCHLMTGEADYLLRVMVPDLDAYEDFVRNRLHAIAGINSITTSLVYGTVNESRVMPLRGAG